MNTATRVPTEKKAVGHENASCFYTHRKIEKGSVLFLDVVKKEESEDKKKPAYLGFGVIIPKRFEKVELSKPPVLIFRVENPEDFHPEIHGERWKVHVRAIEPTLQTTLNKKYQRVYVHVNVVERMEITTEYYDKEQDEFVNEVKSGRATIRRLTFPVETIITPYKSKNMLIEVSEKWAMRKFLFEEITGGISKRSMVAEKISQRKAERAPGRKNKKDKQIRGEVEKEVDTYFESLPQIPEKLREDVRMF